MARSDSNGEAFFLAIFKIRLCQFLIIYGDPKITQITQINAELVPLPHGGTGLAGW